MNQPVIERLFAALLLFGFCLVPACAQTPAPPPQSPVNPPAAVKTPTASPDAVAPPSLASALKLYRERRFDAAEQEYNALINGAPDSADAYIGLARVYLKQGKPAEAYTAATRAVAMAPDLADAQVALGEVDFRQGKLSEAEKEFIAAINSGKGNARAYLGEARVSIANSYYKQAKYMLDAAHRLDPGDPDVSREWFTLANLRGAAIVFAHSPEIRTEAGGQPSESAAPAGHTAVPNPASAMLDFTCRPISQIASMHTNLRVLHNGAYTVAGFGLQTKINGVDATLQLDTGAHGILLNRRVAEKAGVKHLFDTNIKGIGDRAAASGYVAYAESIQVGDLGFRNCPVEVIEKSRLLDSDGLIGGDIFQDFLVDIDFPSVKFALSQLPSPSNASTGQATQSQTQAAEPEYTNPYIAPEMRSYTKILRFGHDLLVPARVNQVPPKLFLVDTGSQMNVISPPAAREVTGVSSDSDTYVKGLSGNVKNVLEANEVTLTFGHLRQKNQSMTSFDLSNLSESMETELSGILGLTTLSILELKIDYRDGLIDFVYDPKKPNLIR